MNSDLKFVAYGPVGRLCDLTGRQYGILKVLGFAGNRRWFCKCDCGNVVQVITSNLNSNRTKSCGCTKKIQRDTLRKLNPTEYRAYCKAKERCCSEACPSFKDYGGRGIEFRFDSFCQFFAEVGSRPSASHSVGRIRNSGHYEPGNIRWEDPVQQANNTRRNVLVTIGEQTETVAYWCKHFGISHYNIYYRKNRLGMTTEEAILDLAKST